MQTASAVADCGDLPGHPGDGAVERYGELVERIRLLRTLIVDSPFAGRMWIWVTWPVWGAMRLPIFDHACVLPLQPL